MEMLVLPSWRFLMPHTEGYEFITAAVTRLNSEESERTGVGGGTLRDHGGLETQQHCPTGIWVSLLSESRVFLWKFC